jgi:RimJ/RimL family protein N-acetyltransferase
MGPKITIWPFGQNAAARAAYERLGYQEQTLKLARPL